MAEARIDKWLWASRIFKTRTIAAEACKKGRVSINGTQVKPSRMIKPGEVIQVMVRMNGTYLRFRSAKSPGPNPLILRKRKMVRVGIRIVKQYTTPSTINLYCSGMIRRYENTNRIRNATKGMENGVNITETALAALMRVLSVMICCCSMAISLVLHYHSFVIPLPCPFLSPQPCHRYV